MEGGEVEELDPVAVGLVDASRQGLERQTQIDLRHVLRVGLKDELVNDPPHHFRLGFGDQLFSLLLNLVHRFRRLELFLVVAREVFLEGPALFDFSW